MLLAFFRDIEPQKNGPKICVLTETVRSSSIFTFHYARQPRSSRLFPLTERTSKFRPIGSEPNTIFVTKSRRPRNCPTSLFSLWPLRSTERLECSRSAKIAQRSNHRLLKSHDVRSVNERNGALGRVDEPVWLFALPWFCLKSSAFCEWAYRNAWLVWEFIWCDLDSGEC